MRLRARSRVVLPEPDGPISAVTSPAHTSNVTSRTAVRDVTFDVCAGEVTALIGPSGSGKTTLLRALNRMHDAERSAVVTGTIRLGDLDVYGPDTDATLLRSRVGMVFQRPNPFPT